MPFDYLCVCLCAYTYITETPMHTKSISFKNAVFEHCSQLSNDGDLVVF